MKKLFLGLCVVVLTMFVSVNRVRADIGYLVPTFITLEFEKDKWNRAEPDAAGCITYSSSGDDARVNLYKTGKDDKGKERKEGNVYKFPRDKKVIVCRETVHLDPSGEEGEGLANIPLGFRVFKFNSVQLPAEQWDQAATTTPSFIIKYTSKANNALIKIDDRIMAGPNMSKVFLCDNVIHADAGIKKVPGLNPNPPNVRYTIPSVSQMLQTHIAGTSPADAERKIRLWLIDFITKTPNGELPDIVNNPTATTDQILHEILNDRSGFLDFTRFVYRLSLGRELTHTQAAQWISGGRSLIEILSEIGAAQQILLNNLRSHYRAYTEREATTVEVNAWIEKIAAGKTEDQIKIEFRFLSASEQNLNSEPPELNRNF